METKMEKIEYALDSLSSNHDSKNVLLAICENSEESEEMITPNTEEIHYELRSADGVLQYRFLNASAVNNNTTTTNAAAGAVVTTNGSNDNTAANVATIAATGTQTTIVCNSNNPLPGSNCQFFVINDVSTASRPCLISPKTNTELTDEKPLIIGNSKKRDEKRRATHNEVERRRRNKINQWIFKLRDLLPDSQDNDSKSKTSTSEYSKGGILIRACEYIRSIKEQNQSLQECLKENEKLRTENASFKEEILKLRKESERLKILLSTKTVKIENNDLHFETTS